MFSPAVAAFLRPFGSKRPEVERPTCGRLPASLSPPFKAIALRGGERHAEK